MKLPKRHDAVDFLPDADEIERWPLPVAARLTLHALAAMLLIFLVWASVFEVERIVTAHGRLVTPLPRLTFVFKPTGAAFADTVVVRGTTSSVLVGVDPWSGVAYAAAR